MRSYFYGWETHDGDNDHSALYHSLTGPDVTKNDGNSTQWLSILLFLSEIG